MRSSECLVLPLSSTELAEFHARCQASIEQARQGLKKAIAEAERRGVPLHEIIPVH